MDIGDTTISDGVMEWNADNNVTDITALTQIDRNATIRGFGLGLVNLIEMLDGEGSVISFGANVPLPFPAGHTANAGVTYYAQHFLPGSDWDSVLDLNSTIWTTDANYLHSSVPNSRRIRLTTPFGSVVTDDNSSGSFTFVGTPDLAGGGDSAAPGTINGTLAATFSGGGFNGIDTYDFNTTNPTVPNYQNFSNPGTWQDLVINGQNFLGLNQLKFIREGAELLADLNMTVDPRNPPAGVIFAADGSKITITGSYLHQNAHVWANTASTASTRRFVELYTVIRDANTTAIRTPYLTIDPAWNDLNP